jgi:Tol biopolymer transport system component
LVFQVILFLGCSKEEEDSGIIHFPNCDLYPIYEFTSNYIGRTHPQGLSWSPDTSRIVFPTDGDLWSITSDGEELTRLTDMPGIETYPYFCPVKGADMLVFAAFEGLETYRITTLKLGIGPPQIVKSFIFNRWLLYPSWSHDGQMIVFLQDEKDGIYKIPAAGGEVTQIPNSDGWSNVSSLQASPGRSHVIFTDWAEQDGLYVFRLKAIHTDGGEPDLIFASDEHEDLGIHRAAESYDGTLIACSGWYPEEPPNLFLLTPNGGDPIQLTDFTDWSYRPEDLSWSLDGEEIIVLMELAEITTGFCIYRVKLKL